MILLAPEILKCCSILEGSKSWYDYEKAKRFVNEKYSLSPRQYEELIKVIAEYIGV